MQRGEGHARPIVRDLGQGEQVQRSVTRLCWLHGLGEFGLWLDTQNLSVPSGVTQDCKPLLQALPLEQQHAVALAAGFCLVVTGAFGD